MDPPADCPRWRCSDGTGTNFGELQRHWKEVLVAWKVDFFLHEIGAMDPTTLEMIGEEEHAILMEHACNSDGAIKEQRSTW